jgi:hypothetical protein
MAAAGLIIRDRVIPVQGDLASPLCRIWAIVGAVQPNFGMEKPSTTANLIATHIGANPVAACVVRVVPTIGGCGGCGGCGSDGGRGPKRAG